MKKLIFLISVFLIFSCSSNTFYVIGEKDTEVKNIHKEYYNIATEYFNQKKYSNAIEYYTKSSKDKSLYTSSMHKLGVCYTFSKDYNKAISIYEKLLKKDKDNINLSISLAYVYAKNNEIDKAVSLYKSILDINKDNQDVYVNYISLLLYKKDLASAKAELETLESSFPNNSYIKQLKEELQKLENED